MSALYRLVGLFWLLLAGVSSAAQVVEHGLQVRLQPEAGTLQVQDRVQFPAAGRHAFVLHQGLSPRVVGDGASLLPLGRDGRAERYLLITDARGQATLSYGGEIRHPLAEVAESLGRSHQRSAGFIGAEGVFLDGAAPWYPRFADALYRFDLSVELPAGWLAVSQGEGPALDSAEGLNRVHWRETQPQDDLYLVAAPFHYYESQAGPAEAQVFLRRPDAPLAARYLDATERYLGLYSRLLGDYPYPKFALVENFWDTGYGMPSFTLLGSRVIRLPFIVHTSYPHEVLHNWWGNGVYVDDAHGNWSEGLTTYLADHLLKEQAGQGAAYRRDALQGYGDYVTEGGDFPLRAFRGRHSSASQSVGYGKGLMFFHMLRRELGDQAFVEGLRRFYSDYRFRSASFDDLRASFESVAGRSLAAFFGAWLERTGAPTLSLTGVVAAPAEGGYRVSGVLRQGGDGEPFPLRVPVLIHQADGQTLETQVELTGPEQAFSLEIGAKPLRLDVDPRFDLFRRLYPEESPPTFGALFGADAGLILLPAAADADLAVAYADLATAWTRGYPGWSVKTDAEVAHLPADRPVWLLGWENRHFQSLRSPLASADVAWTGRGIRVAGQDFGRAEASVALTVPRAGAALAWLGGASPAAVAALARKLPHYGKYGQLVFAGDQASNRVKAQWPVLASPLSVVLAPGGASVRVEPAPPLADLARAE